jgi:hypothetical protein
MLIKLLVLFYILKERGKLDGQHVHVIRNLSPVRSGDPRRQEHHSGFFCVIATDKEMKRTKKKHCNLLLSLRALPPRNTTAPRPPSTPTEKKKHRSRREERDGSGALAPLPLPCQRLMLIGAACPWTSGRCTPPCSRPSRSASGAAAQTCSCSLSLSLSLSCLPACHKRWAFGSLSPDLLLLRLLALLLWQLQQQQQGPRSSARPL